jgi:hypothetical protein
LNLDAFQKGAIVKHELEEALIFAYVEAFLSIVISGMARLGAIGNLALARVSGARTKSHHGSS